MCGIFAYTGEKNNAPELIFEGLKSLEYRGYDSWGIAARIKEKKGFEVERNTGKLPLKNSFAKKSDFAIGHTRWATHGGVTVENAHPHLDCTKKIAVVHNGIIENYESLKKDLLKKGHKFTSDTDTEVVPHLIEEYLRKEGFASSVRDVFNLLKGFNAIVVSYAPSSEIIACKNGSPLIAGVGKEEFFLASDLSAILPHTKKVIFLNDNQMAILGKNVRIFSLPKGRQLKPKIEKIDFDPEKSSAGKYKHFMLKEIYEQPKVILNLAKNYSTQIGRLSKVIKEAKGIFLIGAGTAYHACLSGVYLFSRISKKHINTVFASEFNYLEDFLNKKSLIIALSQSGETVDVIESLDRAKEKGSKIAAVTNVLGSTIYRLSDYKFLLGAGPEKAVASTKAYTAKLSVLILLSYSLIGKGKRGKEILIETAKETERILNDKKTTGKIKQLASLISKKEHVFIIGRGLSYPSALEAALKIKEVSYIHTEGLAGGELKHGPIALISKDTPCIVFAPNDETYNSIISNATEIKARGGTIIGISFKNSSVFDHFIEVKDVNEGVYIVQVVVSQLLAYYIAIIKKLDPDKPRNLAKSVTVK